MLTTFGPPETSQSAHRADRALLRLFPARSGRGHAQQDGAKPLGPLKDVGRVRVPDVPVLQACGLHKDAHRLERGAMPPVLGALGVGHGAAERCTAADNLAYECKQRPKR